MKCIGLLCALALTLLLGGCAQQDRLEAIGVDEARQAALSSLGLSADQLSSSSVDLSSRNGVDYYAVAFTVDGAEYRCDVDALTGAVIESQVPAPAETPASEPLGPDGGAAQTVSLPAETSAPAETPAGSAGPDAMLTLDEAKDLALTHAGCSADQVTFTKGKLDRDDKKTTYDLEFYTADGSEYDYEIDAYTGAVLSVDHDAGSALPSGQNAITAEQAVALALSQVPGAAETHLVEFQTDRDDGRLEYEGTIVYNGMEYEFEIDAYSGAFRSWDAEPIND